MSIKKGEFHIHSTNSDGVLTIPQIFEYLENKIEYISITDHDIVDTSVEAARLAPKYGLKSIIGVEVSSYHNNESIHILGYFKDSENVEERLKPLSERLNFIRSNRLNRMYLMKEKLFKYFNIDLNVENLLRKNTITRGSIAREIIAQGYNYTMEELFEKVIGHDCIAYVPATKISSQESIDLIHECGGLAVLAHPTLILKSKVEEFVNMGIDGIEAIYPLNKIDEETLYRKIAKSNNLFITAGNDFHSFNDPSHGDLLQVYLDGEDLDRFISSINNLK